jgi:hypothetical protein
MLAMAFREKGMRAEMLREQSEDGGPVCRRTEFIYSMFV